MVGDSLRSGVVVYCTVVAIGDGVWFHGQSICGGFRIVNLHRLDQFTHLIG
jgi:hypothetical protein